MVMHARPWKLCLVWLICAMSGLQAQDAPEDRFEVMLKFDRGRLVCARSTAKLTLSKPYRDRLRKGITDSRLVGEFEDAIDRQLRLMPKPYVYALTDDERTLDKANQLNKDPAINSARQWGGDWRSFPKLQGFVESLTEFSSDLGDVKTRSGLADHLPQNPDDISRKPRVFRVREPFSIADVHLPTGKLVIDDAGIRKLLAPFEGLPGNPDAIRSVFLRYYAARGITPRVEVHLDETPKKIDIFEADRIAHLLLPGDVEERAEAELIAYEALPERFYRAFRTHSQEILALPLGEEAKKRSVDLTVLLPVAGCADSGHSGLPVNEVAQLQQQQLRLIALGYQGSLFDFDPSCRLVDLVVDRMTLQEGAAAAANPALGSSATPENASDVSARPGAQRDIAPTPVAPRAAIGAAPKAGITPRYEQKNFIGGGLDYRPEQGVRAFGTFHRTDVFGRDRLSVQAGGQGSGFGSGHYVRDYVAFGQLHRRLSVDLNGGTDFISQRILAGVHTDERRTGGAARGELEVFRDLDGQQLLVSVEGRGEKVTLTNVDVPTDQTSADLAAIDVGLNYVWTRRIVSHPSSLRLSPLLRLGSARTSTSSAFSRFQVDANAHAQLAGPLEADVHARGALATTATPIFEQPSLGTDGSVRGFRSDDALGRQLWAVQNELWLPVPAPRSGEGLLDFMRRNLRLAAFYDVGGMYATVDTVEGARQGVGGGLRLRYQGVILAFDWAHGFGPGAAGDGGNRTYFTIRLP